MSAYRTAATAAAEVGLACVVCGSFAEIPRGQATFHCARCGREGSANEAGPGVLRGASAETRGRYTELDEFARTLGLSAGGVSIALEVDGLSFQVSLDIDSGSVRGLEISATCPGLPEATFRRETVADVDAKSTGVARELQTGDAHFDAAVYVESDAADDDLRLVLEPANVRAAIVELLRSAETLTTNGGGVSARRMFATDVVFTPAHVKSLLSAMRVVAGAPRPLRLAPVGGASSLYSAMLSMLPLSVIALGSAGHFFYPTGSEPWMLAIVAGVVLAAIAQPLLTRALRGRSSSHRELPAARAAAFVSFPVACSALLLLVNGAFDRSPIRERVLVVEQVEWDGEEHESKATARGSDGFGTHEWKFSDRGQTVKKGQRIRVKTHAGALGFEWQASPAVVETDTGTLADG